MKGETYIMDNRTEFPIDSQEQSAVELPDREALSLVNANLALPINAAVAANVLSDNAAALANAQQSAPVNQGMMGSNPLLGTATGG
jgi:hypothetical protein